MKTTRRQASSVLTSLKGEGRTTPDFATAWHRIRQHEGEPFQLICGDAFSYETFRK